MKYAIVSNDKVINIAISDEPIEDNWILANDEVAIGDSYQNGVFVKIPHEPTEEELKILSFEIRMRRNLLLQNTDFVVIKCLENNQEIPISYKNYRQELRDIPQQTGFPKKIDWPNLP